MYGSSVLLLCRNKSVTYLVVGDNLLLLLRDDSILALIARDNDFYTLLEVGLVDELSAVSDGSQSRLIFLS